MSKPAYYFGTMRKMVSSFGAIFSDIHITNHYESGESVDIRVPLNYGPRNVWYARMKERMRDEEGAAKIAQRLPRISFELKNMAYANDRKVPKNVATVYKEEQHPIVNKIYRQYSPIPWDFQFTVSITVKNIEDGLRIIEQIVPLFRPDHTITVEEIPNILKKDLTVNMVGIQPQDTYEGPISTVSRVLTWDIDFTVAGHIMPPINEVKLIKELEVLMQDEKNILDKYTKTADTEKWETQVEAAIPTR